MSSISLKVELNFTYELLQDLLITAVEGGSNYWCVSLERKTPPEFTFKSENGLFYDTPFNVGGAWKPTVDDYDGDVREVNLETLKDGIQIMFSKYPEQFSNILKDNWDAWDADAFFQCVILKSVIFS